MSTNGLQERGAVLVLQADLRSLHCDHWLLPVGRGLSASRSWNRHAIWEQVRARLPKRMPPGQTTLGIPWEGAARPWPTLVDTGPRDPLDRIDAIAKGFLEAAWAAGSTTGRAVPLLALPVLSTGHGGKRQEAGFVLRRLLPVLEAFVSTRRVDVALVCWSAEDLAAAQAARTEPPPLEPGLLSSAHRLAALASEQKLVVFMGAGVSAGAGLPTWGTLLDGLAEDAGFGPAERSRLAAMDPLDRAQLVSRRLGDPLHFKQAICAALRVHDRVAVAHALLAALPVRELITTNYDDGFERAAEATRRPVAVLPYAPASGSQRWLLKMHGSVTNPEDIVLTREDYVRYGERSAALAGIVQAMLITRHMLFVGFSMTDDNFHRIVDAVRRALAHADRELLGTAVMLGSDPLFEQLWGDDLDWVHVQEDGALGEAARRFEIFLDAVSRYSATSAHLLNERFAGLLSEEEQVLAANLVPLEGWLERTADRADLAATRASLARFLRELGADL